MNRVRARTGTGRYGAHQSRVDRASRAGDANVAAGELVRHSGRRALLACVGRHARTAYGMPCDSRMPHGRVPREVGAHTCSHHL